MRWLIGTAATICLAASGPAFAQGNGQGNGNQGNGKSNGPQAQAQAQAQAHDSEKGAGNNAGTAAARPHAHGGEKNADRGNPVRISDQGNGKMKQSRAVPDARKGDVHTRSTRTQATRRPSGVADVGRRQARTAVMDADDFRRGYFLDGRYRDDSDYRQAYAGVPPCPPGLAKKNNGCIPPGIEKQRRDTAFGFSYAPALFGIHNALGDRYAYRDGYLLPLGSGGGYIPLLGGGLAVGQVWPSSYPSRIVPKYVGDYFGIGEPDRYRYADDVIYRVDPDTAAIEGITALLTGSDFAVGSALPPGYDVYNLPGPYRDRYVDSPDALYRFSDGRIYEVDPSSMLIARAIDLVL